jgi:hypothetical protein
MKVKLTGYTTFGVKKFMKIADTKNLTLFNLFGFGLWILRNGAEKYWKE